MAHALTPATAAPAQSAEARSSRVERVVSPGGIEAWLVRQTHLPVMALSFAVRGGAAQDPAGREGAANLLAAMMDEGAGDLDSEAFNRRLQDRAIEMSFAASRDLFSGSVRSLSEHRGEAMALLKLALTRPRLDAAPMEQQLALIRAHPQLAGKAAIRGELTDASTREQKGAGLDQCSPEEFARLHALNAAYEEKFGFPFIIAVRGHTRGSIIDAMEQRLANDPMTEHAEALRQISRIARLRLGDKIVA